MRLLSWSMWIGILAAGLAITGCQRVPVPDVVGQAQATASTALTDARLSAHVTQQCSDTMVAGLVISQNPAAGAQAFVNSTVGLVVSSGMCPVTVPDVVGQGQTEAFTAITGAGLTLGTVAQEYSDTVAAGLVISQNPAAGGQAPFGSVVSLVVSLGPRPITGSIVINNDDLATNTPNVTLTLTWAGGAGSGVVRMRFSDDGETWPPWELPQASRAYTLPAGDGYKTVRVQYKDGLGYKSAVFSDFIRFDDASPTGAILINNGDIATTSPLVTLTLTYSDGADGTGVAEMRFSDDGETWTDWEPVAETRAYTLPATNGHHTVRVQYVDWAGNKSAVYNDYINLQMP